MAELECIGGPWDGRVVPSAGLEFCVPVDEHRPLKIVGGPIPPYPPRFAVWEYRLGRTASGEVAYVCQGQTER